MLELRQLGGALARPLADLSPMGRRDSRFVMFGLGMSPTPEATPELAQLLQEHLAYVAEEMRPYETGATYVNFLVTTFTGIAGRSKPRHAEAASGVIDFST